MTRLAQLEQDFQAFVLEGTTGIEQQVVGTVRVPIATRLKVYSDAYRARLKEALESNYPVMAKLLGAEQFDELAATYIDRHASAHFSIRWYGDRMANLLGDEAPYREQPLLCELAAWEWAMTLAFDAADAAVLKRDALEGLAPEQWAELRFKAQPAVKRLSLYTNVPAVWRALNKDEAPPAFTRDASAKQWLIWRRGLDTFFRPLTTVESRAVNIALSGQTFASICEDLAQTVGEADAPSEAAKLLAQWLNEELFSV